MGDFINDIQCDELDYQPTSADWNEYQEWYDGQEACYPEGDDLLDSDPIDLYGGDDSHYWQYDE